MTKPSKYAGKELHVSKEVEALVKEISSGDMYKNARSFSKGVRRDAKLNAFLTSDLSKGVAKVFSTEFIQKTLDKVEGGYGWTEPAKKEAALVAIFQGSVEDAVDAKRADITANGELVLNDEQKEALARKLVQYGDMLRNKILVGALDWANAFGLLHDKVNPSPAAVSEEPVKEEVTEAVTE